MTIRQLSISILFAANICNSQTSNLTSSPYSIFGLGKINDKNTGITNSMGMGGIALSSENEINGLNPASLASIKLNSFFFDIGVKAEINNSENRKSSSSFPTFGFSNFSLAFPLSSKSGFSLSLIPFTEVGYIFRGIVQNIDGSQSRYVSNIIGNGGLNNINMNYGRKLTSKLNIGLSVKYLFGKIEQTEFVNVEQDNLFIDEKTYYTGFSFGGGMQYQIKPNFNLASTFTIPADIGATRDRNVSKVVNRSPEIIENVFGVKAKTFTNPADLTVGFKYNWKNFNFITDYKRSFWDATNQKDNIGKYVDSNMFSFGIERFKVTDEFKKNSFRYRIGFNYDDGNLEINNNKISTMAFTAGIGIPFGVHKRTSLNLSYSFGNRGAVSTTLIRENFHSFTINCNLTDNWFVKRKYD
jgi:hypothetical protein